MNRKVPLRKTQRSFNSTLPPRTKPMSRVSDKQRKLNQSTRGIRRDPIEKFQVQCDYPGCQECAQDPHEIVAGHGYRSESMCDPRLLMYVCRKHHELIQGMPYAKQIAIVARATVRAVNRVKCRKIVSSEKVAMYLTQEDSM